jgi:hypothetical protein
VADNRVVLHTLTGINSSSEGRARRLYPTLQTIPLQTVIGKKASVKLVYRVCSELLNAAPEYRADCFNSLFEVLHVFSCRCPDKHGGRLQRRPETGGYCTRFWFCWRTQFGTVKLITPAVLHDLSPEKGPRADVSRELARCVVARLWLVISPASIASIYDLLGASSTLVFPMRTVSLSGEFDTQSNSSRTAVRSYASSNAGARAWALRSVVRWYTACSRTSADAARRIVLTSFRPRIGK